jgi:hypothetical protein
MSRKEWEILLHKYAFGRLSRSSKVVFCAGLYLRVDVNQRLQFTSTMSFSQSSGPPTIAVFANKISYRLLEKLYHFSIPPLTYVTF